MTGLARARALDRVVRTARGRRCSRSAGSSAARSASGPSSTRSRSGRSRMSSSRCSHTGADAGGRARGRIAAVALALASAILFGAMSVGTAVGLSPALGRRPRDAVPPSRSRSSWVSSRRPPRRRHGACTPALPGRSCSPGSSRRAPAQILVMLAIREDVAALVGRASGAAPLVSVTIALISLGEPASVAAHHRRVADRRRRARARVGARSARRTCNRIGLVLAFAGATLFAIRDNLVRHLAVGQHRGAAGGRRGGRAARRRRVADRRLGARRGSAVAGSRFLPGAACSSARSYVSPLRGVLPRPGHRRRAARRDRVARRRCALCRAPPRTRSWWGGGWCSARRSSSPAAPSSAPSARPVPVTVTRV